MAKQKLDIGLFSSMYSQTNGTAHAVRFLSEALAKTGHNIHVFAPRIERFYRVPRNLFFHDLGGIKTSQKTGTILSFPLHKYFFCQHDYLDIIHIHTHTTIGALARNWATYLGIPLIGTHNSPLQFNAAQYFPVIGKLLIKTNFLWKYERYILNKYDLIHVATRSKKELLREYKFREPIIYFSNGIHDLYFRELKVNGIREKYGISEDKKLMLYASRLSPEKHMVSVIKNFKQVNKEVPDAHLLIVGSDGPSSHHVKKLAKRYDYVSYGGRVPFTDLIKLFKTADITCLWSWVEAEGLVLIEAMAQGTPSVGTNWYGIKDIIRHGKTGYLANNLEEFKDYVIKLFKDDDLRAEFGKNAREIANYYRISRVANIWIEIYKFIIDELYPLRYYGRDREERVDIVKDFIKVNPIAGF